jgi:hypothetical protein
MAKAQLAWRADEETVDRAAEERAAEERAAEENAAEERVAAKRATAEDEGEYPTQPFIIRNDVCDVYHKNLSRSRMSQ